MKMEQCVPRRLGI